MDIVSKKKKIDNLFLILAAAGFPVTQYFIDGEYIDCYFKQKNISIYIFDSLTIVANVVLGDVRHLAEFEIEDTELLISFLKNPVSLNNNPNIF